MALTSGPAPAATINWHDFALPSGQGPTYAPGTNDRISLQVEEPPSLAGYNTIQIVFKSEVTWRKGIELDRRTYGCGWLGCSYGYKFFAGLYTQDGDQGPITRNISVSDARNMHGYGRLRFGKAGFGGIWHGDAYVLHWDDAHAKGGRRYTFTWLAD